MQFSDFGLNAAIMAGVEAAGYSKPTPIQSEAVPVAMQGHDLMGIAQTGTGKTAAFALPMMNRFIGKPRKLRGLVIGPTRELAEQIQDSFRSLGAKTGLKSATIYGGVGMNPQLQALRQGVDIVVACPGRLLDHMQQRTISLADIEVLVLDEADQMFDMGFLPSIERIIKALPRERQTMLFSATMPPEIRTLASRILRNPKTVQVGKVAPAHTIAHAVYPVAKSAKTAFLLHFLNTTAYDSVLVFMRTKHAAKKLAIKLEKDGYAAASLQGNLSQNKRQAAMEGFRTGKFKILVATDIAARGIDVSRVSHVVNFDVPSTAETYQHRIGRTGRAEKSGEAVTLMAGEDASMIRDIERYLGKSLERKNLAGFVPPTHAEAAAADAADRHAARTQGHGQQPQRHGRGHRAPQRRHGPARSASSGGRSR
jgi:ATP-dependent RNA helicase RhlE